VFASGFPGPSDTRTLFALDLPLFRCLAILAFHRPTPFNHPFAEDDRLAAGVKERRIAIYSEIVTFTT